MTGVETKKKKGDKQYFTQATEDAIVKYNNSTDFEERSRIYRDEIHYGFFKLTENIIHTFKYYHTEVDNIENLQHEVIIFLLNKKYKEYIPEGEKTEIFREKLFGKDPEKNLERAKNMAADTKNMKKGGKVSSASKRADGCAQRGKTKGRMV